MTTEIQAPAGISREEMIEWVRESGLLDELAGELRESMGPANQFLNADEGLDRLEQGIGSGGFPWMYWRKTDGSVITGPEPRETMYRIYISKGYTPLPTYGLLPTPGSPMPCCRGKFMRTEQFHVLLARGGAKELSIQQVIAAGWHERPPVVHGKKVTFPQLKGLVIEHVECDECDKNFYGQSGTNQIIQALRQHCRAAHEFNRREVDEMLYRIGYLTEEPKKTPVRRRRTPEPESDD